MEYRCKPIVEWPGGKLTPHYQREQGRFSAPWGKTLRLLERELRFLAAKNIILQLAVRDDDIRLDGGVKASARSSHPGAILTFDSKHGPLSYWTDLYQQWGDNVRAIALALEALRTVDRYGVAKEGSQYKGYKQLPATGETSNGRPKIESPEQAAELIARITEAPKDALLTTSFLFESAHKEAMKRIHPDKGGTDADLWVDLQDAAAILRKHHGL